MRKFMIYLIVSIILSISLFEISEFLHIEKVKTDIEQKVDLTKDEIHYDPVVCIVESDDGEHKRNVMEVASMFTDVELFYINFNDFKMNYENKNDYSKCDVFNLSLSLRFFNYNSELAFEYLFKSYDAMFVFSGGNYSTKNTINVQKFNKLKKMFPNEKDRLIFVGQYNENNDENKYSFGKELDILAPSTNIEVNGKKLNGTSFAAPMVSAKIANIIKERGKLDHKNLKKLALKTNKKTYVQNKNNDEPDYYNILDFNF